MLARLARVLLLSSRLAGHHTAQAAWPVQTRWCASVNTQQLGALACTGVWHGTVVGAGDGAGAGRPGSHSNSLFSLTPSQALNPRGDRLRPLETAPQRPVTRPQPATPLSPASHAPHRPRHHHGSLQQVRESSQATCGVPARPIARLLTIVLCVSFVFHRGSVVARSATRTGEGGAHAVGRARDLSVLCVAAQLTRTPAAPALLCSAPIKVPAGSCWCRLPNWASWQRQSGAAVSHARNAARGTAQLLQQCAARSGSCSRTALVTG
jgi:hypothetical protein